MSISTALVKHIRNESNFSLTPKNLEEAMQYAKLIADSDFCPKESKGKPGNILVAIQYGSELGLSPMQALQNISVINGRPCLWGDALLGLVKAHHLFLNIYEEVKNDVAYCRVERKNSDPVEVTFSIEDAKKANLWGKAGPWSQYPKRMLQLRARGFALRDAFPDVLKGLTTREEVEDYQIKTYVQKKLSERTIEATNVKEIANSKDVPERDIQQDILDISWAESKEQLQELFTVAYKYWISTKDKESLAQLIEAKDLRKAELETENEVVNPETGEVKNA